MTNTKFVDLMTVWLKARKRAIDAVRARVPSKEREPLHQAARDAMLEMRRYVRGIEKRIEELEAGGE